jgi:hypothetical protein
MDLDWTRPSSCGHTHDMGCFDYYVQGSSLLMTEIERSTMTWRWAALSVYLLICFYDFLFVPVWYGLNRPNIEEFMVIINSTEHVLVQMELMQKLTGQHSPFTLMGGGLFHLAFGAILTGSAVGMRK